MTEAAAQLQRLRAVIVDDETLARDCIRLALQRRGDIQVVAECEAGDEAVDSIRALKPDLVFLDVQMPGMDGFGVVERIGAERMPAVVFVTAYDAHALRAFEIHALDYVLKPFDDARIAQAIEHAREQIQLRRQGEIGSRLAALVAQLRGVDTPHTAAPSKGGGYITRISVRADDRLHFIRVSEIDYFSGAGNYVELHVGTHTFRLRTTVSGLSAQLNPAHFARIHRSTIVNIDRIREVQPWVGGDHIAILHSGQKLRVSRTFADELLRPLR